MIESNDAVSGSGMGTNNRRKGCVFSWGLKTRGRLGLDRPNDDEKCKYQSKPIEITTFADEEIIDISAGKKHALAVSAAGCVFAWGANSAGECSVVPVESSILSEVEKRRSNNRYDGVEDIPLPSLWDDVWAPRKVIFQSNGTIKARSVSAGGIHSAVVDSQGFVYTWGGGGQSSCLGHGDIPHYEFGQRERDDATRRKQLLLSGYLVSPKWAEPRLIEGLAHECVFNVSLGERHGAAVTKSGSVYIWGDDAPKVQKVSYLHYRRLIKLKLLTSSDFFFCS